MSSHNSPPISISKLIHSFKYCLSSFSSRSLLLIINRNTFALCIRWIISPCHDCQRDSINKNKYSQHSSIIWPVWLNGWVFVYELSGCGFKSNYSHWGITKHVIFWNILSFTQHCFWLLLHFKANSLTQSTYAIHYISIYQ